MHEPTGNTREPQGAAVGASPMAPLKGLGRMAQHGRSYALAVGAGLFLSLVGAFGTDDVGLLRRTIYWVFVLVTGAAIGQAIGVALGARAKIGENRWLLWATTTLIVSVPVTLIVWFATAAMFGEPCKLEELPYYFGAVIIVSAPMTGLTLLLNRADPATHAPPPDAAPTPVRFMARLTPRIMGGLVWAVESEDHYLRIHTSKGQDLILMRLVDAVAELDGIEGAQVHRSWWVAKDGVAEVRREAGRVSLLLKDGAEAPVSRPNVKALRAAGWL